MAKRTHHPNQLLFDFDAPIADVVELRPSGQTFGIPVSLEWDGPASIAVTTPDNRIVGHVLSHLVQPLGRILSAVDVQIEATLGEIDDRSFEVIVLRTTDDGVFRNVVRCVRTADDTRLAA